MNVVHHPLHTLSSWSTHHPWTIVSLLVSLVMLLGSGYAAIHALRTLPVDYFVRPPPARPWWKLALRNVLGVVLVLAGIAMLVLPGQGVLSILLGLSLIDFRAKHAWMARLLCHPTIAKGLEILRRRVGREPFQTPCATPSAPDTLHRVEA